MDVKEKKKSSPVRIVWELLKYLMLAVLCAILGCNAYLVNAQKACGNAVPMPFGVGISEVVSGSMEPAIPVGALLIIVEQPGYSLGDIVVYQSGSIAVVHRIIEIDGDTVVTKGDANNVADKPINSSDIRGRAAVILPKAGYAVRFIQTLPGMLLIAALAVLLLEHSFRKKQKRDEKRLQEIKDEILRLQNEIYAEKNSEGADNCRKDVKEN